MVVRLPTLFLYQEQICDIFHKSKMKNSTKAALLSGLAFPGLGQVFLKHYKRAAIIIVAVLAGLTIIILEAIQLSLAIMEKIMSEGGEINMETITAAAAQAVTSFLTINLGFILIILFWIIGTVDAYMIGKKKDKEEVLVQD